MIEDYFAVRNQAWQFLSMDTGLHDRDPFTVAEAVTFLEQTEKREETQPKASQKSKRKSQKFSPCVGPPAGRSNAIAG